MVNRRLMSLMITQFWTSLDSIYLRRGIFFFLDTIRGMNPREAQVMDMTIFTMGNTNGLRTTSHQRTIMNLTICLMDWSDILPA